MALITDLLPTDAGEAGIFIWWTSLVLGLVVALVVTVLLWLIHHTAVTIDGAASKTWDTGQRVANNTIHIPILYRINTAAGKILGTAAVVCLARHRHRHRHCGGGLADSGDRRCAPHSQSRQGRIDRG